MELEALGGIDTSLTEIMTSFLKDEIQARGDFSTISLEEIEALANRLAIQQQSGACTSSECLADMGKALGTKLMVYGSISRVGETYSVSLRLLDTESKEAVSRVNKLCKCSEEGLFEIIQKAANDLMDQDLALVLNKKDRSGATISKMGLQPQSKSTEVVTRIDDPGTKLTWQFFWERETGRVIAENICQNQEDGNGWRVPTRSEFKKLLAGNAFQYSSDMPAKYFSFETWGDYGMSAPVNEMSPWFYTISYYDLANNKSGSNNFKSPGGGGTSNSYHVVCVHPNG